MLSSSYSESSSTKRRATSMKQVSGNLHKAQSISSFKSLSLKRDSRSDNGHYSSTTSLLSFISGERRKSTKALSEDQLAETALDAQLAKIRGELEAMRREGQAIAVRVQDISARTEHVVSSRCNSLEMVSEVEPSTCQVKSSLSSDSLHECDSKRDSGFVFDPVFEADTRKISLPNNLICCTSFKKARSTTALDSFIRNDLYDDSNQSLKATSCDRLSCFSDSAILSIRGFRHPSICILK